MRCVKTHPSPVRAQQAWTCHECVVMESSVRHWEISAAVIEPFTSCLLARMRTAAFCRSCSQRTKRRRVIYQPPFSASVHVCINFHWKPQKHLEFNFRNKEQQRQRITWPHVNTLTHSLSRDFLGMLCHGFLSYGAISHSDSTSVCQTFKHE